MTSNYPEQLAALDSLLNNDTLGGVYFLVYTWLRADRNAILNVNPNLYNTFSALGVSNALIQADNVPFIFFTRVGYPSSTIEVIGATDTSFISLQTLICNPVISGIPKEVMENRIEIYPNPAIHNITVTSSNEMEYIEIYNMLGEKVLLKNINAKKSIIYTGNLSPGIFNLFICHKDKTVSVEKVIVTK